MPQVGEECGRTGALAGSSGRGCPVTYTRLAGAEGPTVCQVLLRAWCVMALCDPVRCRSRPALQQSAGLWVGRAPVSFMRLRRDTGLGDDASGDQGESGASVLDRNHIGWRSLAGDRKRGPDIPGSPLQGHHLTDL